MKVTVASVSDTGRVRQSNEDSHFANGEAGIFIVCDGMGGHSAGEVASRVCCDTIVANSGRLELARDAFNKTGELQDLRTLQAALSTVMQLACAEIFRQASKSPGQAGMGTTCTLLLFAGKHKAIMAHVGDSRLYLLRRGNVHRLSEDHTFVADLLRRHAITKDQARNHPQGNVLTRAMGVQSSATVDTMVFDMDEGDTFMLCSDGVYNYFPDDEELRPVLSEGVEAAANKAVHLALERGGHDNCTAIVIRAEGFVHEGFEPIINAEERIRAARATPMFAHLNYNEAARVVGLAPVVHLPAGTPLLREGQAGHEFFVLLVGEVELRRSGKLITVLKSGATLGEMAMVDNAPRSASAITLTDTSFLMLRRNEFFAMIRDYPVPASKVLWNFVTMLTGRLRVTNDALFDGKPQEPSEISTFNAFSSES